MSWGGHIRRDWAWAIQKIGSCRGHIISSGPTITTATIDATSTFLQIHCTGASLELYCICSNHLSSQFILNWYYLHLFTNESISYSIFFSYYHTSIPRWWGIYWTREEYVRACANNPPLMVGGPRWGCININAYNQLKNNYWDFRPQQNIPWHVRTGCYPKCRDATIPPLF